MRVTTLLMFAATGLLLAARPLDQDQNRKDMAQLQGTWTILSVEIDGKVLPMDAIKNSRLTVHGNRYSFVLEQARMELTFKLDADANPKAIDLFFAEGADPNDVYRGIYDLDDGMYTVCRSMLPNQPRPAEFVTTPDSGLIMVTWTRMPPPRPVR